MTGAIRLFTCHLSPVTCHLNYFSYFSEIEETFVRRRGKNLLLSPLDWALIEAWKERGIPLHVVLRGIETIFDQADKQPARKRQIKSLVYCRDEVENLFAVWLDAQIGNNLDSASDNEDGESEIPFDVIISHLQKISASVTQQRSYLNGSWRAFAMEISTEIEKAQSEFVKAKNLENLEARLSAIDLQTDEKLPAILGESELLRIKAETAAQLRSHKNRMSAEVYAETFKNLLIKNLRAQAELPRFSLFYL